MMMPEAPLDSSLSLQRLLEIDNCFSVSTAVARRLTEDVVLVSHVTMPSIPFENQYEQSSFDYSRWQTI